MSVSKGQGFAVYNISLLASAGRCHNYTHLQKASVLIDGPSKYLCILAK